MRITWEVDDGYAGIRSYPVEINDGDIRGCDDESEAIAMIEDIVQEEFKQRIAWHIKNYNFVVDKVFVLLEDKNES